MNTPSLREEQAVAWLRGNAIPVSGVAVGHGCADLQPLKKIIGNARIVALGEATHGTREFFQLKHRLLEFLVTEMGFTTFAIEANWPEALAVNEYVQHGRGDPAALLAGLGFWTWNTQEVLEMIRWMRNHNARSADQIKITFAGFDAQFTALSVTAIKDYLSHVDAEYASEIGPGLRLFETEYRDYSSLDAADVDLLHATAQAVSDRLHTAEQIYLARSPRNDWLHACQHAKILRQVDQQRRAGDDHRTRYLFRDTAMAENISWILATGGRDAKAVVWAHNAHVARDSRGIFDGTAAPMGMQLAQRYDLQSVSIGFAFGEGAFQAVVREDGGRRPIREVTVGPAPDGSLDAVLTRVGLPVFLVDLRQADGDSVRWLHELQMTREIGAFFTNEDDMPKAVVPAARYDVLAFVARTTRARPVH